MGQKDYREKVKKILEKHELYRIPVDVEDLARQENFIICKHNSPRDGFILINTLDKIDINGHLFEKIISLNSNHTIGRTRFTLAHELGHYFLEYQNSQDKSFFAERDESIFSNQKPETDINNFASELLMPYELLDIFINKISKGFCTNLRHPLVIASIAQAFNTSLLAAEIRLEKYLGGC